MTGFRVTWFLQDSNGKRQTEPLPDLNIWAPYSEPPKYMDANLIRMVQLASQARHKKIKRKDMVEKAISDKEKMIEKDFFVYKTVCSGKLVQPFHFSSLFTDLTLGVYNETLKTTINNEDTETGLMIYFAIVYCAEPVALTQFLHSLLVFPSKPHIFLTLYMIHNFLELLRIAY